MSTMSTKSKDLESFFLYCLISVAVMVAIVVFVPTYFLTKNGSIKSKELITPEIKLVVENNKVDTIYIYRLKK